jgi:Flp pilus assembly protein TadD
MIKILPTYAGRALLACGLLLLPGCQESPQGANGNERPSLKVAHDALRAGQAEDALAIAHGVLSSDPNNIQALDAAGDAYGALGDTRNARLSYQQALSLASGDVQATLGLAKLTLKTDAHGAEQGFRGILVTHPDDPAVLTDLGIALDLQGHHLEAQNFYRRALAVNPALSSAHVNLGLSLALSGKSDDAVAMLREDAVADPTSTRMRANLAVALVLAGKRDEALETLRADLSDSEAEVAVKGIEQLQNGKPAPGG